MKTKAKSRVSNGKGDPADKKDFLVVGIGASAGGVKALKEFFAAMPEDSGMAFVVILHLSRQHKSSLSEIIQRETEMQVRQVTGTVEVEPNNVYVIPPANGLALADGIIKLTEPSGLKGRPVPIDLFFRTLADAYGSQGIAIVLSGTGTDGTLGLKRVKEHGGIGIVQDPSEAEYDGMPRSAINTGLVDLVLRVGDIPRKLIEIRDNGIRNDLPNSAEGLPISTKDPGGLREVLTAVGVRTGHDFSNYKSATLLRRIARRLQVNGLVELTDYIEYLKRNPEEAEALQRDLLITVTDFFRDKEAWEVLEKEIIPKLFEGKGPGDAIRIWIVGCATGEEAYSLAILLNEFASRLTDPPEIMIFASDINEQGISTARECFYEESIVADVSPARLLRFFVKEGGGYRVRQEIREMVLFAPHNILRDPPFSKIDLITCRNLMIYLDRDTQLKVLAIFSFALRPDGYLFLGKSESAESASDYFAVVNKKHRIYRSQGTRHYQPLPVMPNAGRWNIKIPPFPIESDKEHLLSPGRLHDKLAHQFAPPSVLTDEELNVIHVSENAARFLQVSGGEPSRNLLKLVTPALRLDLQSAIFEAKKKGGVSKSGGIPCSVDDSSTTTRPKTDPIPEFLPRGGEVSSARKALETPVNITVRLVNIPESENNFYLVMFDESKPRTARDETGPPPHNAPAPDAAAEMIRHLEEQLQLSRERLRTTVELNEASHEELKASNEELQALNEELRSASEELETSKEELQSLNEELLTVNAELRDKVDETARANSDLQSLIQSTDIGTLFLDRDLRVRRYTPRVSDLFNIIHSDVGRPFEHITHKLDHDDLVEDAREVMRSMRLREVEVRGGDDDSRYLLRLAPYRTLDDKIDGVVLSFQDITKMKRAGDLLRESEEQYRTIVNQNLSGIGQIDLDGNIVFANDKLCEMVGYSCRKLLKMRLTDVIHPDDLPASLERLARLKNEGHGFESELKLSPKNGPVRWIHISVAPMKDQNGKLRNGSIVVIEITERKRAEAAFQKSEERVRLLTESFIDFAIFSTNTEGLVRTWNVGAENIFGYTDAEIMGRPAHILFVPEDQVQGVPELEMKTAREKGRAADERWHLRKDGTRFYASGIMAPLSDGDQLIGYAKIARDLTEQKQAEENLRRQREELESIVAGRTAELGEANAALREQMEERRRIEEERFALLQRIVTTQEDERRRIARDMHDSLGQQLTALRLKIASVKSEVLRGARPIEELEALQQMGQRIDTEVNFLVWELRPTVLDDLGLVAAIENYVREWSRHSDISAEFHAGRLGRDRLEPNVETNLYRITQEALNNAYKHSRAKNANIVLESRKNEVVLVIEDDGVGLETDEKRETKSDRGLGLIGMRERAASIGGQVEIESSAGKGTTVFVRVPIA